MPNSNYMSRQWTLTIWSVPDCFEIFKTIRDKCWCGHSGVQTQHISDSNGNSFACKEHNLGHRGSIINIWCPKERRWMADGRRQPRLYPDSAMFIISGWEVSIAVNKDSNAILKHKLQIETCIFPFTTIHKALKAFKSVRLRDGQGSHKDYTQMTQCAGPRGINSGFVLYSIRWN